MVREEPREGGGRREGAGYCREEGKGRGGVKKDGEGKQRGGGKWWGGKGGERNCNVVLACQYLASIIFFS